MTLTQTSRTRAARIAQPALGLLLLASAAAAAEIEPEAEEILRAMSAHLSAQATFSVRSDASTEMILHDGRKVELHAATTAHVDRARGFRLHRVGPLGESEAVFDGARLSLASGAAGLHASADVEGGQDAALDALAGIYGDAAGGGIDLLYVDPAGFLLAEAESGRYVGILPIRDVPVHHLSFRAKDVDWQLWVRAEGPPLPVRYVITSKWITGAPQFAADFSGWAFGAEVPADDFAFAPPPASREVGAHEIDALAAAPQGD